MKRYLLLAGLMTMLASTTVFAEECDATNNINLESVIKGNLNFENLSINSNTDLNEVLGKMGIDCDNLNINDIIDKNGCLVLTTVCEQGSQATTNVVVTEATTEATTNAIVTEATTEATTNTIVTQPTTVVTTEATTEATTTTPPTGSNSQYVHRVLELVNQERAKNGLSNLTLSNEVSKVAQVKAEDMMNNNYFSHTSPTYGSPFDMLKQFGVSYRAAGENIAKGQRTPEVVVEGWMNSEGHRANILNKNFTQLGVGYSVKNGTPYWVQMFIG